MKRSSIVVLGLGVVAAVLAWWLSSRGTAVAPPDLGEARAAAKPEVAAPAVADAAEVETGRPEADPVSREAVEVDPVAPVAASGEAVLFGRCVDEHGAPLAGVTVKVHGWVANDQRLNAYRREHGDVDWVEPAEAQTGPDGRFAARFVPPPPYQFTLDLEMEGRVRVGGRWSKIEPDTSKDLGDVVLGLGAAVTGRVVDTDGVPQEGVEVRRDRYNRSDRWRGEIKPRESYSARSQLDGTFRFSKPLAPAIWNLGLRHGHFAEPQPEVTIEAPSTAIELVVKRAADVPAITGLVVDQAGVPIRGAQVEPDGRSGGGWMTTTRKDGTFRLERREAGDPDGPFALLLEHRHCEYLRTEQEYEWGARDVRVVMQRGIDVVLNVTRASDGSAVEEFGARILPAPKTTNRWSSRYGRIRGGWKHEGGQLVVEGIRRGEHVVVVEPRDDSGLACSEALGIQVGAVGPVVVAVQLPDAIEQTVRVVDANGKAMSGSKVELIEVPAEEALDAQTPVSARGDMSWMHRSGATRADEATTGEDGGCTVRGAVQRSYGLRVTSAAHVPVVRSGVKLSEGTLEIVVPTGATLHVTLGPPELLADLYAQAMLPRDGKLDARELHRRPGVLLRRKVGDHYETHPTAGNVYVPFDDDAKATIGGIPAGTWELQLRSSSAFDNSGYSTSMDVVRTGLVLEDGSEQQVALDLPNMRLGKLIGTLRVNGEPAAHGLQLIGDCGLDPDGKPRQVYRNAQSDEQGRFEALLPEGSWRVQPYLHVGEKHFAAMADGAVHMVGGQDARADFDVRVAEVRVRLVAADGSAVVGAQLSFLRDGVALGAACDPTDEQGRTTVLTTPGPAAPELWIRSLQDPARLRAFWRESRGNQAVIAAARVQAAPVVFTLGSEAEIVVRMPAEWDR